MKKILLSSALFIFFPVLLCGAVLTASLSQEAASRVFYVDSSSGNDANDGLSEKRAWQSLDKVNQVSLQPGDSVLFRRGKVWRGQLKPKSGASQNPIHYGAYGQGAKPLFLGSVRLSSSSSWIQHSDNIWKTSVTFPADVGNLLFVNVEKSVYKRQFGYKKWSLSDLKENMDFYFDLNEKVVYLRYQGNPASQYRSIEAALTIDIVDLDNLNYVTLDGLALRYGGAHGFQGMGTSNITIRNSEISYIGGGDLWGNGSKMRYGNAVEFWAGANNNLVENNYIYQIYDSGLTNQNSGSATVQSDITYRNNRITKTGMNCFEMWNNPSDSLTQNILFEHNTCTHNGDGWGGELRQRGYYVGGLVGFLANTANWKNIVIRKNIFSESNSWLFYTDEHPWISNGALDMNDNCWYNSNPDRAAFLFVKDNQTDVYSFRQYDKYTERTKQDSRSLFTDPMLASKMLPKDNSLCKDMGVR